MNQNKYLILVLSIFVFAGKVNAQWQGTMFPNNGIIYSLYNNRTDILTGVDASFPNMEGVYIYGNSWAYTTLKPSTRITSVIGKGTEIYAAGLVDVGVFYSNDYGTTWYQTYTGLPTTFSGQVLAMNTLIYGDTGVFAGSQNGVYKTFNKGYNWYPSGMTNIDVRTLAISGKNIYAGTYGNGAYLSINEGNSWTAINTGLTDTVVNTIAINGNDLYAGTDKGIFISRDQGSNWSKVTNGLPIVNVNHISVKGSFVIAATSNQVFISSNNGITWSASNTGLFSLDILSSEIRKNDVYVGANGSGVFSREISNMTNCFAYNTTAYDSIQNLFIVAIDSLTSTMGTSFRWDFGDGSTSSSATPIHTYSKDSLYNLCMTTYTPSGDSCTYCHTIGKDSNGNIILKNSTVGFTLNVKNANSTGIIQNSFLEDEINVYPNPFSTKTTISFSNTQKVINVKLLDLVGKEIISWETKNMDKLVIEKESLLPGIYNLQISSNNNNVVNRKIIIQ